MAQLPPSPPGGLHVGGAQYPSGPPQQWPTWVPPLPGNASAPSPAPGRSGDRRAAGLVAAAAAVALLLIVGVVAWATDDGGDDPLAADPSSTTAVSPTVPLPSDSTSPSIPGVDPSIPGFDPSDPGFDPSDPSLDPFDDARPLEEVLPGLIDFVEVTRGHRFRTEPVVEALPEDEFLDRFEAGSSGDEAQIRAEGLALRALGILDPDSDPVQIQEDLGDQGVLGFYDPESKELVVRGDQVTPYVETIIAHELTHALDDQYFDLIQAEALAQQPDESGFGFLALVEGSARRVQLAYEAQLGPSELLSAQIEAFTSQLGGSGIPVPEVYGIAVSLPYGNGVELVDAVLADGGNPALDAAFRAPPTTSEQVLDPVAYEASEPALVVPAPPADGSVAVERAFGAVDVRLLEVVADPGSVASLIDPTSTISPSIAVDPLIGFGGGRFVSWEEGGQACIRFTVLGDSPGGLDELSSIIDGWARALGDVDLTANSRLGGITATRCV